MTLSVVRLIASAIITTTIAVRADAVSYAPLPTATGPFRTFEYMGCFNQSTPMKDYGNYEFVTSGLCQKVCYQESAAVMAMTDGTNCWCGNELPSTDWQVGNSTCDTPCAGFKDEMCGGNHLWSVYVSGYSRNRVNYYQPQSSSVSSTSTVATATSSSQPTGSTTATPTPSEKSGSSSTVGIAVGVVVGVVVVVAAMVGLFFFMRGRGKKREEEGKNPFEENEIVYSFTTPYSGKRTSTGTIPDQPDGGFLGPRSGPLRVVNAED